MRNIAAVMGLALYLFASALYVGTTQERAIPFGLGDSGYHVAELDAATAGIIPIADNRTIASGPNYQTVGGNNSHGSVAILKTVQKGITSWMWQFKLHHNDAPDHLRKEDLIYPFHYFW